MPYRHLYGKTLICCSYLYLHLISPTSGQVSTYPLILGNIKTNGLITSSKYPIKYLESVFVLINFETNMLSTLTSRIFIFSVLFILLFIYLFFCTIKFLLLLLLFYQSSRSLYFEICHYFLNFVITY